MPKPLEGIRVLDFTIWQHGAYGTTMLADLGADVLKVEEPESGDLARWYISQSPDGFNSYFQAHNRGKKSLSINLKHPKGKVLVTHRHQPMSRTTESLMEMLMVITGRARVTIYDQQTPIEAVELSAGQGVMLVDGGIGIEVLEDAQMLEFKNGPFLEDKIVI